ncbi:HEAT repeat domain-containing protein [Peribacillus alkalitolerans]|uniref:HEAT repeat domain-containing protein n=1 Tax=Peribacillus alkalitolerans TaxID=1550385 RepID=UPI0019670212|nr:SEC-C metal-binding domain-containing protein [Peribacillus alkalitolerans]
MTFLEKVKPFITHPDPLIQDYVLHMLQDYPNVPGEWTEEFVKIATEQNRFTILSDILKLPVTEEALKALLQGVNECEPDERHFYIWLFERVPPEMAVKFKKDLSPYLTKETLEIYNLLLRGDEDDVWGVLDQELHDLAESQTPNLSLAKHILKKLVEKKWFPETEVAEIMNSSLGEDFFSDYAILGVYAIKLMELKQYIPILASLLTREQDDLLEEVADTLISFQSDEVVEAVAPYLRNPESNIYASSIVANIKTPFAVQTLRDIYNNSNEIEDQEVLFEPLCHQLSEVTLPEINDYMKKDIESYIVEREHVAYGFYTVMGLNHPKLESWREIALENETFFRESKDSVPVNVLPIVNENKVGRNDPCTCGSGKKYKKCCGK